MRLDIVKAHGSANDFVVVEDLADDLELDALQVRALCDRRRGVGADGLIRVVADGPTVFMDYRNSDGSLAEMCGNGARVFAKYCFDRGILVGSESTIGTRAGTRHVRVHRGPDGLVARVDVDMGPPVFDPAAIPVVVDATGGADGTGAPQPVAIDVDGSRIDALAVGMGNPHAVLFVDDVAAAPVRTLGPTIERSTRFPNGTNVSFARIISPDRIDLRVWERGSGETQACGTAACGTVVAAAATGRAGRSVDVALPGGIVHVEWADSVVLSGPAVEVYTATVDVDPLVTTVER